MSRLAAVVISSSSRSRFRRRSSLVPLLVALLVATMLAAVRVSPAVAQDPACTEAVPIDEVEAGAVGEGLTVTRGTIPETFGAEVLGVLVDGIAPGLDMILADLDSPAIDRAGVWAGMSGSPVLAPDGRLIGAVAYSLSGSPSSIAGLVPGESMLALYDYPAALSRREPREEVKLSTSLVAGLDAPVRAEARAGGSLRRLALPIAVSSLRPERLEAFGERLGLDAGDVAYPAGGTRGTAAVDALVPGGNFAAAISYGSLTAAGVGTTTDVCDGQALAFGHPFNFTGSATLSAHAADAIVVQPDEQFGSYKVANIGGLVGTVDQDRFAGIRAAVGPTPDAVEVSSTVGSSTLGTTHEATTWVNQSRDVPDIAPFHALAQFDRALDKVGEGQALVTWTLRGTADGRPWAATRVNRFSDTYDISYGAVDELAWAMYRLGETRLADVTFDDVRIDATLGEQRAQRRVSGVFVAVNGGRFRSVTRMDRLDVRAGDRIRVRTRTARVGVTPAARVDHEVTLVVPRSLVGQRTRLRIHGGQTLARQTWQDAPATFSDLLDDITGLPRNHAVVTRLDQISSGGGPSIEVRRERAADAVVTGSVGLAVRVRR